VAAWRTAFPSESPIRFSIETSGSTCTRCPSSSSCAAWARPCRARRARVGRLVSASGSLSPASRPHVDDDSARRHLSLLGGRVPAADGVGRMAAAAEHLVETPG
jgi:hypothetical protein